MSYPIYNDLKEQGLILSQPEMIQLPPIRPPKLTFFGQLTSFIGHQFKLGEGAHHLKIVPVLNSGILVGRANTLLFYKYQIQKQTKKPLIRQQPKLLNLSSSILNIHICDTRFLNDRSQVPFLIQSHDNLTLFYLDLKNNTIVQHNNMSYVNLYSVQFLCEKEVLVMTRSLEIHHLVLQGRKIKMKNKKMQAGLPHIPKDQYISTCKIVGNIDQEQDSIIAVFYLLKKVKRSPQCNKDDQQRTTIEQNFEVLKVKQYLRTFQGKIQIPSPPTISQYTVMTNLHSSVLPINLQISCVDNFYCIQTKHQILILKKKFQRYLFIDNVMEKIHDHQLKLNGRIVSSSGHSSMELSFIIFGDPKCNSKILDSIQVSRQLVGDFLMLWPFKNQKETCLMLLFQKQRKLFIYNIIKMQPMKKMLQVVRNIKDKSKISIVQQLAVNLGINKKDFYLTLWHASKRQIPDIYQFLLPCADVNAIKKQIRFMMRRKKIAVTEFVKILEKLALIIRNQLKINLSQPMLKEYIKNDFLLRKIKLKQKDKSLDHRDLQKVYKSSLIDIFVQIVRNDLFPQEKQLDPLHAMVQQSQKQHMQLGHVFQQFRIIILQNYNKFIVDFLSMFKPQEIVQVIQNYSYLLPTFPFQLKMYIHQPQYMTQVQLNTFIAACGKKQQLWFADMTSIQFNRQLSKQRIQKQLHQYYPTSKITDAINILVNSSYSAQKLKKHGLISCTIKQYQHKLTDIYNIKLFMNVCEYSNSFIRDNDQQLSQQLVKIFKNKNKLTGDAYQNVRLYTSMHRFMLKNDFTEKKEFTTEDLISFTSQDLVALFFLENRQRKQCIFNQFRELYVKLDDNPLRFNQVIRQFINSQNCSRIELQIFIKQVLKKGNDFQISNQQLIQLLIDGFCMKLQIRQDTDTKHFLQLMEQIELNKNLGMKINKIMQIRKCLGILNVFNCQKFTYFQMLSYQKDNQIFQILLQRYFNQQLKKDFVRIQQQQISLDFCRNMLTILLYITQTIYYDVQARDLLIKYGQVLIEWRQFEVIKGIIYDEDVLEKLKVHKEEYVEELVERALLQIAEEYQLTYNQECKRQIIDILSILPAHHYRVGQEKAKLELAHIFQSFGVNKYTSQIFEMCDRWYSQSQREGIINSLFSQHIQKLSFATFKDIYSYLQLTIINYPDQNGGGQLKLNNTEYVEYLLKFAQRLLKYERYGEIVEIFAFVKRMNQTHIDYQLMAEVVLKQTFILYPSEQDMHKGKQLLQYFTQTMFDDRVLQNLFQTNFKCGCFNSQTNIHMEREDKILVDVAYTFKKSKVEVSLELLCKIVEEEGREGNQKRDAVGNSRSQVQLFYYSYYFMLVIFRSPHNALRKLDKISYNFQILTNLLFRLQSAIDQHASLWAINSFYIFKSFIKGLLLVGLIRVRQSQNITYQFKAEQNLDVIKNVLKQDKTKYKDLLDSIARLQTYTNQCKNTKKNQKEIRFDKSKLMQENNKPKEVEIQAQVEVVVNNATVSLRNLREMKFEMTHNSNNSVQIISEKQILQMIYTKIYEQKQHQQNRKRTIQNPPSANNNFLSILNPHKKQQILKQIHTKIANQQYAAIRQQYNRDNIVAAVRVLYKETGDGFHQIVNILDQLGVADGNKIDIGRKCKIYQGDVISNAELKLIFPFDFFLEGHRYNQNQFLDLSYAAIWIPIQNLLLTRDNYYMRSMSAFIGTILQSNIYIDRLYVDILLTIAQRYPFTSDSIIRFRIVIQLLNSSPESLREGVPRIIMACRQNHQMKVIIKQELEKSMLHHFAKEEELINYIRGS